MTSMHTLGDELLMERVAARDPLAFELLYSRHSGRAYGYAFHMLKDHERASDIVQDAFLALWDRSAAFDARRGSVRAWLLSIVHHRAIDHVRAHLRYAPASEADAVLEDLSLDVDDTQQQVLRRLDRQQVRDALACLRPQERACVLLIYFGEITYAEAARVLELPAGTVKSRIRLALGKLRTQLHHAQLLSGETRRGA
jgi:RNA polymerase sigma-70 factor (ECF subfamily)